MSYDWALLSQYARVSSHWGPVDLGLGERLSLKILEVIHIGVTDASTCVCDSSPIHLEMVGK
jgi:hypothetical protein